MKKFSDYLRRQQLRSTLRQIPTAQAMTGSLSDFTIDDSKAALRNAYTRKYKNSTIPAMTPADYVKTISTG